MRSNQDLLLSASFFRVFAYLEKLAQNAGCLFELVAFRAEKLVRRQNKQGLSDGKNTHTRRMPMHCCGFQISIRWDGCMLLERLRLPNPKISFVVVLIRSFLGAPEMSSSTTLTFTPSIPNLTVLTSSSHLNRICSLLSSRFPIGSSEIEPKCGVMGRLH
jgi:hypothetical protein